MFREINDQILPSYNSLENNIVEEFYNPILENAVNYKRVSCYFSSKGLALYAKGLDKLALNGGYFQLIISNDISEEDFKLIKSGYESRSSKELLSHEDERTLSNLAYLISIGKADVKIGFVENGLFHSKWGFFKDSEGNIIYFNGSMNETANGIQNNYESFDVDFSWDNSDNVKKKIYYKLNQFDLLWEDRATYAKVKNFNDVTYELIGKYNKGRLIMSNDFESAFLLMKENNSFMFVDNTLSKVSEKASFRGKFDAYLDKEKGFPFIKENPTYREILRIIEIAKKQCKRNDVKFEVSEEVINFINTHKYTIEEYRKSGLSLKDSSDIWSEEYKSFKTVVETNVYRPLLERQLQSAFYLLTQKRAANFSVPGAGKTAMALGVFAYLNSDEVGRPIERMLIVCPKNAFRSWKDEFIKVFGDKKKLKMLSVQDPNIKKDKGRFEVDWFNSNLILVNYESLKTYREPLEQLLERDKETMLIFDEVHRIKGVGNVWSNISLSIAKNVDYKYVLTGTPIPNSYRDIQNFLKILFTHEYDNYFGFNDRMLNNPTNDEVDIINERLSPYFWRINKDQLGVPPAENDILIEVEPTEDQRKLAESIYLTCENHLTAMIRMIQLSTNPKLLLNKINYDDLGFTALDDIDSEDAYELFSKQLSKRMKKEITESVLSSSTQEAAKTAISSKFERGIQLIKDLTEGKKDKIVIWALFVDTIDEINKRLNEAGINSAVVYGRTNNEDRDRLISEFKDKDNDLQVLISNPNTLGESVSLHDVAHSAVYFEFNYNLTYMLQSRDRIHRLGLSQDTKTKYYYLMTVSDYEQYNFIDKKIYDALRVKEIRMKEAIDGDILVPELDDNEIDVMKEIIMSERNY